MVAARRAGRKMGQKGFGNAREVRKLFEAAIQAGKLRWFQAGQDMAPTLVVEDIIGPEPSEATIPALRDAMNELRTQIGLGLVKAEVQKIVDVARRNYHKELAGEKIDAFSLNRLYLGNPGTGKTHSRTHAHMHAHTCTHTCTHNAHMHAPTPNCARAGKTTVAKIVGRVLKALRLLSSGEVAYKTASDFVGEHVGASQQKTAAILELAKGKVLLIDEAYGLDDTLYGKQALDTIVEKVSGGAGEDIAVIMVGYDAQMLQMLRSQNPGLSRRFNPDYAFRFEDFNDRELLEIIALRCHADQLDIKCGVAVKLHAMRMLARRRNQANFGNAGAVTTLLTEAKKNMKDGDKTLQVVAGGDDDGLKRHQNRT
jgi:Cdc6-like AAA superfamily ATPase